MLHCDYKETRSGFNMFHGGFDLLSFLLFNQKDYDES